MSEAKRHGAISRWLTKDRKFHNYPLSDFDRISHELKMSDVILIEGSSRVSRIIRTLTHSPWTHAALYVGRLHDVEDTRLREVLAQHANQFDDSTQLVIEGAMGLGTVVSPLEKYQYFHARICRPKGIAHQDAQRVIGYAIAALGSKYHTRRIIDLARFLLPWRFLPRCWLSSLFSDEPDHGGEVCSSLIARAFMSVKFPILPDVLYDEQRGDVQLAQRNYRLFTPSDFDYSPYFDIIKYPMFNTSDGVNYRKLPWVNKDHPS